MGYDLQVRGGDFVAGPSDDQHIQHLMLASPGHYRERPEVGMGLLEFANAPLSAPETNRLRKVIRLTLEADGYQNVQVRLRAGALGISAFEVGAQRPAINSPVRPETTIR